MRAVGAAEDDDPDESGSVFDRARDAVVERALHLSVVMPANGFFSHVTAAILWGLWLPVPLVRDHGAFDVAVCAPARHPRRDGVRGHQTPLRFVKTVTHPVFGVRLADPSTTWAQLAAVLRDPYDLVAAGDAAIREQMFKDDPPALATMTQLTDAVAVGRRAGVNALRAALPQVRSRSASRPETRCRLLIVDAGMPEPELNWTVNDEYGSFVACVDLAYPALKIAIEYEGEHHLKDPAQWAKDIERYERLARLGWHVVRVTKAALFGDPQSVVRRVRSAVAERAAR
ncbi:DUF559 domain-containing protein [Microbacterium sp. KR10-403]|uniref:endonuclease domain-containing protein n=1 Tax=Microbacterium sp. KR10-403 TaxID=3158581 RepID=UPI0032E45B63